MGSLGSLPVPDVGPLRLGLSLAEFVDEVDSTERRTGRRLARWFRIHWDGDFFSLPYTQAWRATVLRFPNVAFWAYTRSFGKGLNVVPVLRGLASLTLYLSVDAANYRDAQPMLAVFPDTLVSVLAPTVDAGKALYRSLRGGRRRRAWRRSASRRW